MGVGTSQAQEPGVKRWEQLIERIGVERLVDRDEQVVGNARCGGGVHSEGHDVGVE